MQNKTDQPKVRVFLVDDHALVREQLTALIQGESDLAVCGEAEDAPSALSLIKRLEPDLVILDISLKRSSGLDLLKGLKEVQPNPVVLVLSMHEATFYADRALQAGALGYITKEEATTSILSAIRRVLSGKLYLSERMAGRVMKQLASAGQLVPEEVQA
jgi:DNA-binding NarL/FixJ family response regulator